MPVFSREALPALIRSQRAAGDGARARIGRAGRWSRSAASPGARSTSTSAALVAGGAAFVAVAGALVALQVVDQRPQILPAFLVAAALCPLIMLRPAWIVPIFLGIVWTSISREYLGGFSPVNTGAYALLPLAAWFAWRKRDTAGSTLLLFALIALPLVATGLVGVGGSTISTAAFKDLAFLFIVALCLRASDVERTILVLVVVGIFLSIGAVYSVKVHPTALFPLDLTETPPGKPVADAPRAAGPFGESNFFALSLAVLVPFCLHLLARGRWRQWLGAAALLALIAGIFSTGSRGGVLAAGVGVALYAFASGDRRIRIGALAAVVVGAVLLLAFSTQASSSANRTVSGRTTENEIALAMFRDHPLTGVGPDQYPVLYHDYARKIGNDPRFGREPHSLPLQILAEQGVTGAIGWLGAAIFLVGFIRTSGLWVNPIGRALTVSLITYLAGSVFLHGSELRLLYILIGLLLALGVRARPPDAAPA